MATDFHQTIMGHRFFENQLPQLISALNRLSDQLAGQAVPPIAVGAVPIRKFFHEFMDGDWSPFEEACTVSSAEYREKNQAAKELEQKLSALLGKEQRELLEQYEDAVLAREPSAREHAFLVGYQSAVRLFLMGVTPLNTILPEEEEKA